MGDTGRNLLCLIATAICIAYGNVQSVRAHQGRSKYLPLIPDTASDFGSGLVQAPHIWRNQRHWLGFKKYNNKYRHAGFCGSLRTKYRIRCWVRRHPKSQIWRLNEINLVLKYSTKYRYGAFLFDCSSQSSHWTFIRLNRWLRNLIFRIGV